MTRIDIFSGFLGAGKTTLIRKLIAEGYKGEKLVLIENEFGEIAIDGGFLKDAGVEISEMNSGCICCTLVGDFTKALKKVIDEFNPDRVIIEPSGVGKLSDVAKAVERVEGVEIGAKVAVVDAGKCKMYMHNFGEFYNDQVASADLIVLSRTDTVSEEKLKTALGLLKGLNDHARFITTPWTKIGGEAIRQTMDEDVLKREMEHEEHEAHEHHHHHYDENGNCCCGHHHDEDDEDEHEHHHHHHDDDGDECECHEHHHDHDDDGDECECHEHHHHHDHDDDDDECECGCHDHEHGHHHHHHHHADEIFTSWGTETAHKFSEDELKAILEALNDSEKYGFVLRSKGIVDASDGEWLYFDYVPEETNIRRGAAAVTGRFCVIGSKLNEKALKELFNVE
ncbi:MAG: GTP-binding protein [Eubacteriales bacterium]|nr:GTP-binding protein [Eubacteriales bacterium]